tara:strand:- start:5027 stop:5254 length:228 start_codon:yes stop_codon:yes gene_type:complete
MDNQIEKALKRIIKKELKNISNILPVNTIDQFVNNVSPKIEELIEKNGFVKKSKYKILEDIITELEKRVDRLENN